MFTYYCINKSNETTYVILIFLNAFYFGSLTTYLDKIKILLKQLKLFQILENNNNNYNIFEAIGEIFEYEIICITTYSSVVLTVSVHLS